MPKEYGVKLGTKICVGNYDRIGNNIDPRKSKKCSITTFFRPQSIGDKLGMAEEKL